MNVLRPPRLRLLPAGLLALAASLSSCSCEGPTAEELSLTDCEFSDGSGSNFITYLDTSGQVACTFLEGQITADRRMVGTAFLSGSNGTTSSTLRFSIPLPAEGKSGAYATPVQLSVATGSFICGGAAQGALTFTPGVNGGTLSGTFSGDVAASCGDSAATGERSRVEARLIAVQARVPGPEERQPDF